MASATENALAALVSVLAALAAGGSPPVPPPSRNEELPTRLIALGAGSAFLNVLDGDGTVDSVALGSGDNGSDAYTIIHKPVIEWMVEAKAPADRDAIFDAGLVGIYDALRADRTLGATVAFCEVDSLQRTNLNTDGLPHMKAIAITLALTFQSTRPF